MLRQSEMNLVLLRALSGGGDFSELFLEDGNNVTIRCAERQVMGITSLHIHGAGIYVLKGTGSVYVHTNDTSFPGLLRLARQAASFLSAGGKAVRNGDICFFRRENPAPNTMRMSPASADVAKTIRMMKEMDRSARSTGAVRHLSVGYFDTKRHICIANSDGLVTEDERVSIRVRLDTTVEQDGGTLYEFDDFICPGDAELFDRDSRLFAENQVASMTARLKAAPVRSCVVPVVIEGGSGGVLWHEACGHPLEAANVVTGQGEFGGMIGRKVASEKVTLIDDGSIPGMYGSAAVDDEGHPTQKNVLIENGILKGYLCDRKGARILGMESTGSGRRQDYRFAPTSRMHNTYLAPGKDDEEEMIRSMDEGLYVKELGGGSSGADFSIEVKEAYWVTDGKISHQVGGITLSGRGMEIINRVDRVGKNLIPEVGGSFCGGPSGLVPTTAFQPRIRISRMTVGGESP